MPQLNREWIRVGERVCAAVSGGADSVALLLLLCEANALPRNGMGVGLSAVHVHHGVRGAEADGDLEFVRQLCGRLGVLLHVEHVSVLERMAAARGAGESEGLEEAARNVRYEVFGKLMVAGKADSVLTAHTLDDQAETVMMKLLRGAWTEGLSGIYPVVELGTAQGRVVRPLLGVRRVELEEYLRGRGQGWRTDSTNADEAYTRNRVRHTLMPMLREFNPSVDRTLANVAELAREEDSRWESELARVLPQVLLPGKPVRGGGRAVSTAVGGATDSVAIELERLRGFDAALRRRVVRAAARGLGVRLGFDETARLMALAGFGEDRTVAAKVGGRLKLSGGLSAERSARELRLERIRPEGRAAPSPKR